MTVATACLSSTLPMQNYEAIRTPPIYPSVQPYRGFYLLAII